MSLPQLVSILADAIGDSFSRGQSRTLFMGPIIIGYNYFPSEKLSLGIEANYANYINKDYTSDQVNSKNHFITLMPQFQYYWARLPQVEFYSGIKLGASFFHEKSTNEDVTHAFVPAFHVTPLGARIGRKKRFYIDSGTGFDGLLNIGYNIPIQ
ncbi:hypothetical protein D1627_07160 [Pontibacter oryzae]|uniref:Outer membrane protein beta-barrel domain-containing protein n=2 Tax=Pontibacter oryzae TaxID=2304593 RepID=A0A399SDL8_9BACT|nr:hypothetical protein D1627_07160 [Pontibacter oryzae]